MAVIGIMDSGVGGLSVLREILKVLPGEKYIYFSDNAWCPYGDKKPEIITERCRAITGEFLKEGASAMVIACNTATSAAIASLRSEFAIPFVGMEPAVKPAALGTMTGVVGVLATAGTLKGSKYLLSKDRFASNVKILESVGQGFVELVERGELDSPKTEEVCRTALAPLLEAGADKIVLGCTHYPFLRPVLERIAGPGVEFIDPAPAIARRLAEVLGRPAASGPSGKEPDVELRSSGPSEGLLRMYEMIRNR